MKQLISTVLDDVSGVDADGNRKYLSEIITPERYTLLWWHPQALSPASCRSCSGAHGAEPVRLLQEIYDGGCDIVGLSYERPDSIAQYLNNIGVIYPILSVSQEEARAHGVAKIDGEPWPSIPHRVAFLVDEHRQIINRYEVHNAVAFLRSVRDDVKNGPPVSKWEKPKRKKFLGVF